MKPKGPLLWHRERLSTVYGEARELASTSGASGLPEHQLPCTHRSLLRIQQSQGCPKDAIYSGS